MGLGDTLLQPENFGKYFHGLFENTNDAKRLGGKGLFLLVFAMCFDFVFGLQETWGHLEEKQV